MIACLPIVCVTIELLRHTNPDFIVPVMWPPNSSDLNLVDYAIWSVIQQHVYETRVHDIDELRQHLLYVWCSLEQSLIDNAVDQWPTRLACLCSNHRGHFEHILTINLFSLYLMNFTLRRMLDAAADVLEMHYKSIKYHCDVLLFTS